MSKANENWGYVDPKYLQILALKVKPLKERSYDLMQLQNGHRVLDVGCGPGTDTIPLAQFVGPTGQVIGIDNDNQMIVTANRKAKDADVAGWVMHKRADATSIPYNSDYFNSCRCERLFQHVNMPEQILSEMVRVTVPGGWIVVADTDHSTMTIDTPDIDIEWRLRRFRTDRFKNGYAGRQLYRLFRQQNLANIIVEIFPIFVTDYALGRYFALMGQVEQEAIATGIVSKEELQRWHANLEKADKEGMHFSAIIMVVVAGRKS
uniref:2-methoxy-6-polyprenyl-1,4-benzoquinol methylase, mitochondrial n=1 Tax=Candidatus Methanophaga sp. ANME-1 ERB7 TaxID=2759913 RepID=A0A7G9Z698_9EURY|nr:2-methoxy-6-polyprenyl-1,4-benzoquinol methylase, mitochondrial [Methanosarcinales archaeon ANME-1 ERB7]